VTTDPAVAIDIERGLDRPRDAWVLARGFLPVPTVPGEVPALDVTLRSTGGIVL